MNIIKTRLKESGLHAQNMTPNIIGSIILGRMDQLGKITIYYSTTLLSEFQALDTNNFKMASSPSEKYVPCIKERLSGLRHQSLTSNAQCTKLSLVSPIVCVWHNTTQFIMVFGATCVYRIAGLAEPPPPVQVGTSSSVSS